MIGEQDDLESNKGLPKFETSVGGGVERGRKGGPKTKKNDKKSIFLAGSETSPKLEKMTSREPLSYYLSAAKKSWID